MSYHILHQFDEQWFADSGQEDESRPDGLFGHRNSESREHKKARTTSGDRPWLIVAASLLIAACALYFAMDARRQTAELQQRLSELEMSLVK